VDDAEADVAADEDVEAAVFERDGLFDRPHRAAGVERRRAVVILLPPRTEEHDPEALVAFHGVLDELAVARLEDVQREARVRKEDEVRERKERQEKLARGAG